jgi:hypothetical protein
MSLISDIQTDIAAAFDDDLADLVQSFCLIRQTKGTYNPTTGKHASINERYDGRGIFEAFDTRELNNEVKAGDLNLICLANELDEEPKIDDVIVQNDNHYDVKNVKPVHGVIYEVQIRGRV